MHVNDNEKVRKEVRIVVFLHSEHLINMKMSNGDDSKTYNSFTVCVFLRLDKDFFVAVRTQPYIPDLTIDDFSNDALQ